jgi:hypothetical protein
MWLRPSFLATSLTVAKEPSVLNVVMFPLAPKTLFTQQLDHPVNTRWVTQAISSEFYLEAYASCFRATKLTRRIVRYPKISIHHDPV